MQQRRRESAVRASGLMARLRALPRPTLGQTAAIGGLVLLIALVGTRVYGFATELTEVRAARQDLESRRTALETRHRNLGQEAQFVANPDNLEQELRSRYNYKRPDEKVIIVVPPQGASSSSLTQ